MSLQNPLLQNQEPVYNDVELPTKGLPYQLNGTIDKIFEQGAFEEGGIIKVRELTTKDELLWTDKKLVDDLKAPVIMLKNVVLGLKRPELLTRADVEYILLQSRVFTYGNYTNISWTCSECGHYNDMKADYTKLPINRIETIDDMILEVKNYKIVLLPLIFKEAVAIQKANSDNISEQLDNIISCISQVDVTDKEGKIQTVTDKGFIAQWVEQLNPNIFRGILDHFTKVNKVGAVTEIDVKCTNCQTSERTEVTIDLTNFFSEED